MCATNPSSSQPPMFFCSFFFLPFTSFNFFFLSYVLAPVSYHTKKSSQDGLRMGNFFFFGLASKYDKKLSYIATKYVSLCAQPPHYRSWLFLFCFVWSGKSGGRAAKLVNEAAKRKDGLYSVCTYICTYLIRLLQRCI